MPVENHPPLGHSRVFRQTLRRLEAAATSNVPVLLQGESGTGKEVLARHVHVVSGRVGAFVAVNATALPGGLLESELFGHARGAFTGADRSRAGLFQQARGGTLLIDEIGDLPPPLQAKLLRVLQEGEVRPVGRDHAVKLDTRVIVATHRSLPQLVQSGAFRGDLFYRVSVFTVELPALRDRREDIVPLAVHFLRMHSRADEPVALSADAEKALLRHSWPGNIRELENAMRHALVLRRPSELVTPEHLPPAVARIVRPDAYPLTLWAARAAVEHDRIVRTLEEVQGNRSLAARRLGMSRQTLHERLKRLGIGPGTGRPSTSIETAVSEGEQG